MPELAVTLPNSFETVRKWIRSSTTAINLQICEEAIQTFITDRFWQVKNIKEVDAELRFEITKRKKELKII